MGGKSKFRINWRKFGKGNSPYAGQADGTKICTHCGEQKPISEFHRNGRRGDGLYSWCKPCTIERARSWQKRNPKRHREIMDAYTARQRTKILVAYGNKCACCGENHVEFLTIDHKNNDGAAHRRSIIGSRGGKTSCRGGRTFYSWILRNKCPDTLQLLCWNCNCAKQTHGVCPHERERAADRPVLVDVFGKAS